MPAESAPKRTRRGTTAEGRERQLVALAVDLAEQQLRDGTASAQVITHYLKLGSTREKLEQERIMLENKMTQAKTDQIASQADQDQIAARAIEAMRTYGGHPSVPREDEYDD